MQPKMGQTPKFLNYFPLQRKQLEGIIVSKYEAIMRRL